MQIFAHSLLTRAALISLGQQLMMMLTYVVQFVVQSTGVADRFTVLIPPPQGGLRGLAVGTRGTFSSGCTLLRKRGFTMRTEVVRGWCENCSYQSSFGLDQRPVLAVHLVIQATCVAKVVAVAIPAPERC